MYKLRKQLELLPQKLIEQLAISFQKINPEQKGWNTPSYLFWDHRWQKFAQLNFSKSEV